MITAVCLNPCFDKTARVEQINPGGMNRLAGLHVDCSGKGVNVAIMLARFGDPVQCAGILGRETESRFLHMLSVHGVAMRYVSVPGASRTNFKLAATGTGAVTEPQITRSPARNRSPNAAR